MCAAWCLCLSPLCLPRFLSSPLGIISSSSGGEPYDLKVEGAGFRDVDGRYSRQEQDLVDGVPYYSQHQTSRVRDRLGLVVSVLLSERCAFQSRCRYVYRRHDVIFESQHCSRGGWRALLGEKRFVVFFHGVKFCSFSYSWFFVFCTYVNAYILFMCIYVHTYARERNS